MNDLISPEPISNASESGSQAQSALGRQLLSRLVQPAGLMDVRHLPGHRTQAAAQTLLQRSQLPEQIQARYTTVEPVRAMAMPGRSRVESLALGSLDYPELGRSDRSFDRPDLGQAIGMPTLAPTITPLIKPVISRASASDSESGYSSSESLGVPRVQLAPNPESPLSSSELPVTPIAPPPISTGSFRVSRQRPTMVSSPSIDSPLAMPPSIDSPTTESPVLRQLVNSVSPLGSETGTPLVVQRSSIPHSPIPNSQFSILNSQLSTPVSLDPTPPVIARQPEPTRSPDRPSIVLQSLPPTPIQATTVQSNPIQSNPIQATTVQSNIIQALPLTPTPRVALNLPSSNPGVQITTRNNPQKIAMNPIDQFAPTNSTPVSTPVSTSVSTPVPRISRSLLPEIADPPIAPSPATPLPLTQLRTLSGLSIARMPTESAPGELSMPPTPATTPPSTAQSTSSPPLDIKRIAAQVSQLLQRQLTVEHERRGLKSW